MPIVEPVTLEAPPLVPVTRGAHILSLDGFRGLAVVLVVFFHVAMVSAAGRGPLVVLLGKVRESAWIGVEMFFTLSGFLITSILLRTVTEPDYLRNFYVRRTLRIFPLYYGVLLVLSLLAVVMHLHWNGATPYLLLYVQNFRTSADRLLLALSNAHTVISLQHFWSLAVEEQFYLIWPFLVLLFRGRQAFVWVPLLLIVVSPVARLIAYGRGVPFAPLNYWTCFHADTLAWGGLAATAQMHFTQRRFRFFRRAAMALGGVCTAAVFLVEHGRVVEGLRPTLGAFYTSFGALCCGLILLLVEGKGLAVHFFRLGLLRWFGRYSYGIYVFHLLVTPFCEDLRFWVERATGSRPLAVLMLLGSAYMISAGLAFLSFHAYEKQFLKLKDRYAAYSVARRVSRR